MRDTSLLWKCLECGDTFRSVPDRHRLDHCDCGDSWVDHEQEYSRHSGNVELIEDE